MIPEEYCTFETAKLLKEVGFPQDGAKGKCAKWTGKNRRGPFGLEGIYDYYTQPTQAQAMRWLREEHHISIRVNWHSKRQQWFFDMLNIANIYDYFESEDYLPTYESAAEAGIQIACKYLKVQRFNNANQ